MPHAGDGPLRGFLGDHADLSPRGPVGTRVAGTVGCDRLCLPLGARPPPRHPAL